MATRPPELRALLGLYRAILRMHRVQLPGEVRELGDAHVRSEFRAHLKSKTVTAPQWAEFVAQWRGYLAILQPPDASTVVPEITGTALSTGASLPDPALAVDSVRQVVDGLDMYMSPEQRMRMDALQREARGLGVSMLGTTSPAEAAVERLDAKPPAAAAGSDKRLPDE